MKDALYKAALPFLALVLLSSTIHHAGVRAVPSHPVRSTSIGNLEIRSTLIDTTKMDRGAYTREVKSIRNASLEARGFFHWLAHLFEDIWHGIKKAVEAILHFLEENPIEIPFKLSRSESDSPDIQEVRAALQWVKAALMEMQSATVYLSPTDEGCYIIEALLFAQTRTQIAIANVTEVRNTANSTIQTQLEPILSWLNAISTNLTRDIPQIEQYYEISPESASYDYHYHKRCSYE